MSETENKPNSEHSPWFKIFILCGNSATELERRKKAIGIPPFLNDQWIQVLDRPPNFLHVIGWFKFFRQFKKCTIFVMDFTDSTPPVSPFLLPLAMLLIKKPGGPAVVARFSQEHANQKGFAWNWMKKTSDVVEIANDSKTEYLTLSTLKAAFFAAECGHPSAIYKEKIQKERINWLKDQSKGKILEIGCSTGFVLDYVGGGIGIDIDELRLEFARKAYPKWTFLKMDAAQTPFQNGEFDTVLIPDILEHVPFEHAQKIVQEAKRVAKRLIITVPNAEKPHYRKDLVENPDHVWFPKKSDVTTLLGPDCEVHYSKEFDFIYGITGVSEISKTFHEDHA